jgi:hypothetical protein
MSRKLVRQKRELPETAPTGERFLGRGRACAIIRQKITPFRWVCALKHLRIAGLLPLLLAATGLRADGKDQLSPDQAKFLELARQSAVAYTQRLPDFICTQITHREIALLDVSETSPPDTVLRSTGSSWSRQATETNDEIVERLTFFDQKEKYEVIKVDGEKAVGVDHLQFQGAITIGEFGTDLRRVFAPESKTIFTWDRAAEFHGRPINILRYSVPRENGTVVVERETRQKVVVPYNGQVFIDPKTLEVLRITARLEMPPGFPVRGGERMMEYKPITIAGKEYNLPFHAEIRMRDAKHAYVNRIDFIDYHKFVAQSTIHYGEESPR